MLYGSRVSDASVTYWMDILERWIMESNLMGPQRDECLASLLQVKEDAWQYAVEAAKRHTANKGRKFGGD